MDLFLQQLINGITQGSTYAIIAVGYSLVFGVLNIVNMAHGDVVMWGAFLGLLVAQIFGANLFLALISAIAGTLLIGFIMERLAIRPLSQAEHLSPLISTIGVSIVLQGMAEQVFSPSQRRYPSLIEANFLEVGSFMISIKSIFVILGVILLTVGLNFFIYRTVSGKAIQATAENPEVAASLGINVNRTKAWTTALASALGGIAGVLVGLVFNAISPYSGTTLGLKGLVALIVGGVGNVSGAAFAGLFLGVIEVLGAAYVSNSYRDAIAFFILVFVLLIRPSGFFRSQTNE